MQLSRLNQSHLKYRPDIDGLRTLAVVPVILFHAGFHAFSGGFVGVDVFFVISGYLITSIILSELEQGRFSIISFYERRARRILPALFFVMLCCLPFSWLWLEPADMKDFSKSISKVTQFTSNIYFYRNSGYFDTATELKPLLHTWSLAVEEQYYLLFPLLLLLVKRFGKIWIGAVITLIAISSFLVAQYYSSTKPMAAFYLLHSRAWELMIGALVAFNYTDHNINRHTQNHSQYGSLLGFLLICASIFLYEKSLPYPSFYTLAPTAGTALIIAFNTKNTLVSKILGSKPFVSIGLVSYGAYLWHQPLFAFFRHAFLDDVPIYAMLLLVVASFVLALLTWKFIERPFRNKTRFNKKEIFGYGISISIFIATLGNFVTENDGFPSRYTRLLTGDIGHDEFFQYQNYRYLRCESPSVANDSLIRNGFLRCRQSKPGVPEVILLGDSHAEHLFIGLAEAKPNLNIAYYLKAGVPYVTNKQFDTIFNEIINNGQAQHIVIAMFYYGKQNSKDFGLYDGLSITIKKLLNAGKTVSLVGDVPKFDFSPVYCTVSKENINSRYCQLSNEKLIIQRQVYDPILNKLANEFNVKYITIDAPLCQQEKCLMTDGTSIFYRDDHHLNILGSKLIGKYLAEKLTL